MFNNQFVVIEIQVGSDGTAGVLSDVFTDKAQAESKFHGVLSAAAVSVVPFHAAVLVSLNEGVIGYGKYDRRGDE